MPRRILEGNVVSAKNDKTVTVRVERRYMHPMYKKYVKSSSKYTAHDETNSLKEGDKVSIIECRPISKTKRWIVVNDTDAKSSDTKKSDTKKTAAKKSTAKKVAPKKVVAKKEEKKAPATKKTAAKKAPAKKTKSTKKDA